MNKAGQGNTPILLIVVITLFICYIVIDEYHDRRLEQEQSREHYHATPVVEDFNNFFSAAARQGCINECYRWLNITNNPNGHLCSQSCDRWFE